MGAGWGRNPSPPGSRSSRALAVPSLVQAQGQECPGSSWGQPRALQAGGAAAVAPQPPPEPPAAHSTVSLPRCGTDPTAALGGGAVCPHPPVFVLGFIVLGIKVADRNTQSFLPFYTGSLCF